MHKESFYCNPKPNLSLEKETAALAERISVFLRKYLWSRVRRLLYSLRIWIGGKRMPLLKKKKPEQNTVMCKGQMINDDL